MRPGPAGLSLYPQPAASDSQLASPAAYNLPVKERIQKVLANAGVDSRRNVEQMVLDGRVTVNGKVLRELPILIDPQRDKVMVDGESIRLARGKGKGEAEASALGGRLYFMMNKPRGVYTTNVAQGTQLRAVDLLPEGLPGRLYPAGRLHAETRGLLLMTNDGELTNLLTHPRYGVAKTYRAIIDGSLSADDIAQFEKGIWMGDASGVGFKTAPAKLTVVKKVGDRSVLDITMREGKNAEIRRLFAKLGHKVRDLTRTQMGPLSLDRLKPGHVRQLTPKEVKLLRKAAEAGAEQLKRPPRGVGKVGAPQSQGAQAPDEMEQ